MADRNIPRAEDIFSGRMNGKSDSTSNVYKNKRAPAPPSGPLPKIGNYQPKSLMAPTPGGSGQELIDRKTENVRHTEDRRPKQFVIGDKDTPLEIDQNTFGEPVAPPRRKRRAPTVPETAGNYVSDNPLFGRSLSNMTASENSDTDNEEQGGIFDFGDIPNDGGKQTRPKKTASENDFSTISTTGTIEPDYEENGGNVDFGVENSSNRYPLTPEVHQNGGTEYPYIPPPDYEDEEYTFNFDEEGPQLYKEYAGEDFGKYLKDDEEKTQYIRKHRGMVETKARLGRNVRKEENIQHHDKRYKKKRKAPKQAQVTGRSTIRDFTFTDTKIGWGDRTVKSTSAKGRYMKREQERNKVDARTAFPRTQSQGPSSYEDFLMGKTGALDSPNSSDSGVDTGEDLLQKNSGTIDMGEVILRRNSQSDSRSNSVSRSNGESNGGFIPDDNSSRRDSDLFYHSQPKQMRDGMDRNGHKSSIWKRLTWKFRKSVNIS